MPLLDRAFYLLDSARSPQDFTIILDLRDTPEVDRLHAGARSAMNRFPISACSVAGRAWVWRENKYFKLVVCEGEGKGAIERFVDEPFNLRREPPVKQLLVMRESGCPRLATRFHHAAADGLSAMQWIGHQLKVAYRCEPEQVERGQLQAVTLRRSERSVRRSRFAFGGASEALRTSASKRSGSRRWSTICFDARELQRACRRVRGFTYQDLLATCTLEAIASWNNNCGGGPLWPPVVAQNGFRAATAGRPYKKCRIGLWVPVNVRREAREGFGNGTSRVRVYANYHHDASLIDKCRAVREQVAWTTKHGEWVVPELPWFTRLPDALARPLLRRYLNLPQIDMATAVFTHGTTALANSAQAFKHVARIECAGLLHSRQNLAINAATHSQHTWLTLTYDPALLTSADVTQLTHLFSEQIAHARRELS
jgi:hypothetical protein